MRLLCSARRGKFIAAIKFPDGTVSLLVHLTLKTGRNDAMIDLVTNAPHRSLAPLVRETMRSGVLHGQEVGADEAFDLPDLSLEL